MADRVERKQIHTLIRRNNSVNGNPNYDVVFTDHTVARTSTDAAVSYELDNGEFLNTPVDVTYTKAGRIAYVERVTE